MEVLVSQEAQRQIESLPLTIRARIHRLLERLRDWPAVSGVRMLRGRLAGHYRLRTGDYRLQFRIAGSRVVVERVGHRRDFYQE